jgi:hypothetical protein
MVFIAPLIGAENFFVNNFYLHFFSDSVKFNLTERNSTMQIIDNVIISEQVWNTRFSCDLTKCLGKCCQYGDLGAPICEEEAINIEKNLENVFPYLPLQNQKFLQAGVRELFHGTLHIREIQENTPCPLAHMPDGKTVLCSLHSYALDNNIPLLDVKPLWCSLFPLIIKKSADGWMMNLHIPDFCVSEENAPPVIISFAPLLETIFGKEWIEKVEELYRQENVSW